MIVDAYSIGPCGSSERTYTPRPLGRGELLYWTAHGCGLVRLDTPRPYNGGAQREVFAECREVKE